eukprot:CAMPEP_0116129200 /NCGR_PEP_ID=MMETSP0329-20121206/7802_1 /TAXON_ID=697910 /ORGANISM="Pseudo-nitzschia arenysensis, Strain B593" /LENGTH=541 /DNA_ID=CAMNT_0003623461 /DNA_START=40 /DNA_END=1665 /DNA_ORIENTATION=+
MNSDQNNTVPGAEKQSLASTTVEIFDEKIDATKKQESSPQNPQSMNPSIFADASNKVETQQQGQVAQNMTKKKKGFGQKKKNRKKQNKKKNGNSNDRQSHWGNNNSSNNNVRDAHHHDNYHNHQQYYAPEDPIMMANHMRPTEFQEYFIPGNQHTFPIPHPQQQHIFAADGNAKVLLDLKSNEDGTAESDSVFNNNGSVNGSVKGSINGNGKGNINGINYYYSWLQSLVPWMSGLNMIENDTQVDYVVLTRGGESKLVQIPHNVGACLTKELLVQKENFTASSTHAKGHHNGHNVSATMESAQGRPVHGNINANGLGDQVRSTSAEHPAGGIAYSMMPTSGYPHQHPNTHPDGNHPYGMAMNQCQPYNGYGPPTHPVSNGGMHIPQPPYHSMMQQQVQHPPMHFGQYQGMPPAVAVHQPLGSPISGYSHPNGFQNNAEIFKPVPDEAMQDETPNKAAGHGNGYHQAPHNDRRNLGATPNRAAVNHNDDAENRNSPRIHHQHEATPHRGAMRGNGGGDPRRVSISPVVRGSLTPVAPNGSNV